MITQGIRQKAPQRHHVETLFSTSDRYLALDPGFFPLEVGDAKSVAVDLSSCMRVHKRPEP